LIWHQTRKPRPIGQYRQDVPQGLTAIIEKAMAKEAKDRFPTPAALVQALEALPILTGETSTGSSDHTITKRGFWPPRRRWMSKRRWLVAAGAGALLSLVLGTALYLVAGSPAKPTTPKTVPATPKAVKRAAFLRDFQQQTYPLTATFSKSARAFS
jgi:hypothetical protein